MLVKDLPIGSEVIINHNVYTYVGITDKHENKLCYKFITQQKGTLYEKYFEKGIRRIESKILEKNSDGQFQW